MSDDRTKQNTPTAVVDTGDTRLVFGARLKAIREEAGFTAEELAYATKIQASFIKNLEAGEFEKLPGEVFVRGFIKSICKTINHSSEELNQLIDVAYGLRKERLLVVPGSPGASRVRIGNERPDRGININLSFLKDLKPLLVNKTAGYVLAGAAGLVILISVGVGLSSLIKSRSSVQTAQKPASAPVEIHVAANEDPATEQAIAESQNAPEHPAVPDTEQAAAKSKPQDAVAAAGIPSEQVLELKVKDGVNIRINVDKRGWETARYEPETYTIKFKDDVNLLIFDAAAVDINFNGKSIGALGAKGRVRRLSFVAQAPGLEDQQNL